MPQATEKRQHRRRPLLLMVTYGDDPSTPTEWTENLSADGVFINTTRRSDAGAPFEAALQFPGLLAPTPIAGICVIVQDSPYGYPIGDRCTRGLRQCDDERFVDFDIPVARDHDGKGLCRFAW